ncbi:helix-turn-helix domain-containing protein [Streptomyces sp. NPDC008317]|uniref:helix-turn-helix domain-containing protein n=1 Tax=Streptomyces sp. NPDC008317 TaxID=3364827 RepID=UPI0036EDE383
MTNPSAQQPPGLSVSDVVVLRLKEARLRRGWSAQQLAEECAKHGASKFTKSVISNIESGRPGPDGRRRRELTVDEVMTLAYVLDVAPMHLLGLPEGDNAALGVQITPDCLVTDREALLLWIRGDRALPGSDTRHFYAASLQDLPSSDPNKQTADYARSILQDRARELLDSFNTQTAALAADAATRMQSLLSEVESALAAGADTDEILTLLQRAKKD